jgi:hypothetical protein
MNGMKVLSRWSFMSSSVGRGTNTSTGWRQVKSLPKSVTIGPLKYDILTSPNVTHEGEDCFGLTDHDKLTVTLADDMPESLEQMIFCHELLHTFCLQTGLSVDSNEEEKLVLSLAPLLLQFIRNNPKAVEYLRG